MPKPEKVKPWNFSHSQIIYSDSNFSVAWGKWKGKTNAIGLRWDGTDEDKGYPKTFGHPVWFIVPENLKIPLLRSLIGLPKTRKDTLIKVLNEALKEL